MIASYYLRHSEDCCFQAEVWLQVFQPEGTAEDSPAGRAPGWLPLCCPSAQHLLQAAEAEGVGTCGEEEWAPGGGVKGGEAHRAFHGGACREHKKHLTQPPRCLPKHTVWTHSEYFHRAVTQCTALPLSWLAVSISHYTSKAENQMHSTHLLNRS